jgi:HD-GYP domain-containing protein (c-di-GMP phosphodiesterase class II)
VADVYDALTTARSYRDSMPHSRAAQEMRSSHGQFDPQLLEAFLSWAETAEVRPRVTPQRNAVFTMDHSTTRGLTA